MKLIFKRLMQRSRNHKYTQFIRFCNPNRAETILDIGVQNKDYLGNVNFLEQKYPHKEKITALAIEDLHEFLKKYPMIKAVKYNGNKFPFKENSFDYAWSNAVVEHVGNKVRQKKFISEIVRVTRKKAFITTPNRKFLFDTHTRLPVIHWLPKKYCDRIYAKLGKKWATGEYMYLLSKKDLVTLLESIKEKQPFTYKIKNNRFFGMTATFSIEVEKL